MLTLFPRQPSKLESYLRTSMHRTIARSSQMFAHAHRITAQHASSPSHTSLTHFVRIGQLLSPMGHCCIQWHGGTGHAQAVTEEMLIREKNEELHELERDLGEINAVSCCALCPSTNYHEIPSVNDAQCITILAPH